MKKTVAAGELDAPYQVVFGDVSKIVDAARDSATRSVNAAMTAAYWLIGHRIVEFEQSGEERARYGTALMERLAADLTQRFGRGFSRQNIQYMRLFYVSYPSDQIRQALSGKSDATFLELRLGELLAAFPLPWSAYVRLLSVKNTSAREFYGAEALRGGWSVRQLDRQINSQFYERRAWAASENVSSTSKTSLPRMSSHLPGYRADSSSQLAFQKAFSSPKTTCTSSRLISRCLFTAPFLSLYPLSALALI